METLIAVRNFAIKPEEIKTIYIDQCKLTNSNETFISINGRCLYPTLEAGKSLLLQCSERGVLSKEAVNDMLVHWKELWETN